MENTHVKTLQTALQKIGWDIRGRYPNRYIVDHEGKATDFRVMDDRVEPVMKQKTVVCFYFEGSKIELLETGDSVSIGTEKCFALFMNHSMKSKK